MLMLLLKVETKSRSVCRFQECLIMMSIGGACVCSILDIISTMGRFKRTHRLVWQPTAYGLTSVARSSSLCATATNFFRETTIATF